jgi:predicted nucleic acid-binding protein
MAANVLVDAGYVVALLSRRDTHHRWALAQMARHVPPWDTCEAALSEAFHLLGSRGAPALSALIQRRSLRVDFDRARNLDPTTKLMAKYADVPMSLADACLVRMTEILTDPVLLTTDTDFRVYRRHSRHVVPCVTPSCGGSRRSRLA